MLDRLHQLLEFRTELMIAKASGECENSQFPDNIMPSGVARRVSDQQTTQESYEADVTRQEIGKKIDKLMRDYFENQDSEIPDQILNWQQ